MDLTQAVLRVADHIWLFEQILCFSRPRQERVQYFCPHETRHELQASHVSKVRSVAETEFSVSVDIV